MSYPLVCLGNPLLDLQTEVDVAYLQKYGLKENDAILAEEKHFPIYGEVVKKDDLHVVAGGAAQNTARGAQYILPPNSVVYFGAVGKDIYSEKLVEANKQYGLRTEYQVHPDISTGKCAVLLNGVHRSLVTDLGAANHFKQEHLDKAENWELVKNAKIYYIGGYHLTVSPDAIKKLGTHAAETNKIVSLNLSAPFIPQFFKDPLDSVLPYVDFLIANEAEAASYAESHNLKVDSEDLAAIAKEVAKLPKVNKNRNRTVIFTNGTKPTVSVTYDPSSEKFDVSQYKVKELATEKIKDTNGAGDAFAAGFVASLVENRNIPEAINVGHWSAALSIQQDGPTFPFPKQTYA